MKKLTVILMSLFFILIYSVAFAQGCDDDGDEGTDDSGKPKLFGFIQPQYEFHFNDDKNTPDLNENTNTFKFKRARLGVKGNIPYDFKYYVVLENSAFVGGGYPYLLDAFVSYTRYKWAKVSMGSFKQPFGMEINTPCNGLHTINRANVSDQIVSPQRDMGIMLLGGDNKTLIKYAIALMNGNGIGSLTNTHGDNNRKKDVIGRVTLKPLDFLRVGGSFRYGFPDKDTINRTSYAGELEFKYKDFTVQAEYIADQGGIGASGGGCGADPVLMGEKRGGAFVQAMYMTNFNLQPIVKYEFFDPDTENKIENTVIDKLSTITIGVNYFFNDNTRLQLNYLMNSELGVGDNYVEVANDAFLMQVQIKF